MNALGTAASALGKLGDFEVLRELGRGGMGVVYEARQVSLNRKVALKVLSGGLGLTGKAVTRFKREAEAAAKLHHTNIVPIYATGEEDGTHFYALELIEGPSLDKVIRQMRRDGLDRSPKREVTTLASSAERTVLDSQKATDGREVSTTESPNSLDSQAPTADTTSSLGEGSGYFDTVARIIAEVADALDYAHKQGVIHRDIKPSNLLLSADGRLHINDFGLARMLEQPGMTISGEFLGSPAYMSPEQIAAGRLPLDHRTDIYSLGVVLYELLTLRQPFSGSSRDQVLAQIVQKEPKPPRAVNKKVPIDLETICLKAIEKDPDRRYQSAGAMAEDLCRFVNRFAISARRVGLVGRTIKWTRRHPALAVASLIAVIAGASFLLLASKVRIERRNAAMEKALLVSMNGDSNAASKAIEEAEFAGVSLGEIRMLRGQVALHSGNYAEAVQHLEQAVRLLPKSVAALYMLATAYTFNMQWEKNEELVVRGAAMTPVTPEDYLFKGQALSLGADFAGGSKLVDEAVKRRDSPIARLTRTEVRSWLAIDTGRTSDVEVAIQDAQMVKAFLADNPRAWAMSLLAHVVAANLYAEAGHEEQHQAALKQVEADARALEKQTNSTIAVIHRCYFYYMLKGNWEVALQTLAQASARRKDNWVAWYYSYVLYRQGQFPKALEVLEELRTSRDVAGDHSRAFILAELPNGPERAREAYYDFKQRYQAAPLAMLHGPTILHLIGRPDEAAAEYRQMREKVAALLRRGSFMPASTRFLEYQCGELSEQELLLSVENSRSSQCGAHFFIAMRRLAEGDRSGAREHFQKALATQSIAYFSYDWSSALLARLEGDPTWPPWIPKQVQKRYEN